MLTAKFINIAADLELAGLVWQPEIGDEVADREERQSVSILVDPQGMTPKELRAVFMWLPSVEQLVTQVEARQAILSHAGFELSGTHVAYRTVINEPKNGKSIEAEAESLRTALAIAVRDLLLHANSASLH